MVSGIESKKEQIRKAAEASLEVFIRLVHPQRMLGSVHSDIISWWTRQEAKSHQLLLLPRDHQKSALMAYRVAWEVTKNPAIRILYISATSNLATKQLKFIKDILTSDTYRFYWPEMVNEDESKREKWTEGEISVDHPLRKAEAIRDPTIFTAGLTTGITGLHCDTAVADDVVTDDTATTPEGRLKVRTQIDYLASIVGAEGKLWAVGTRYHPLDLYNDMQTMAYTIYDDMGSEVSSDYLYEVFERQVETSGDGTGEYLWPRQQRWDGKWFGFNQEILAKKRAQYSDYSKFRAQYYNNPNDATNSTITHDMFQYFDRAQVNQEAGTWYYRGTKLNIFAAVDFAFSESQKADYTCIAVVGVDSKSNYYVLDIDRFKTNMISDYFDHILKLHTKWGFRKIRAETTVAQVVIVRDLKENYIRPYGLSLVIEDCRPTKKKEERIEAILQPKYANRQIWHYRGGNCQTLEEELVALRPPHDDAKDSVASAIEICVAPSGGQSTHSKYGNNSFKIGGPKYHPRFGGF